MPDNLDLLHSIPVGGLGIIAMHGCEELGKKIDHYLTKWRAERESEHTENIVYAEYVRDSYLVNAVCPRFGTGEAKGTIRQSVRGYDLFIISDVFNHGCKYKMYGSEVPMSPDDHYQDLKRVIAAVGGKARRITVIMPMLYEGRQHKRSGRESLDCAMALQELTNMGVENIITFDAHDARVQNSIPLSGFENVQPTYQMIKTMVRTIPDLTIDRNHMNIISPDEGGMARCIYYSSVLGLDLGMFYKRRDYSVIINGRNPIVAHQYLGDNIEGKDVIIVDDMISSGDSVLDIANKLKAMKARRIFICATFGLFVEGFDAFDKAYAEGKIDKLFTTNLTYRQPELLERPWYQEVDMSKYIAYIVDTLNHDCSVSQLLNPAQKIHDLLERTGH